MPDGVDNVDMNLEDLQLLLRSHQQSMDPNAAQMDVSTKEKICLYCIREWWGMQTYILLTFSCSPSHFLCL